MKIEEPDWVGRVVVCESCDRSFRLEAEEEDKVEYRGRQWRNYEIPPHEKQQRVYRLDCPKCTKLIVFCTPMREE